jgi:high-affinity nickel-transport protein
LNFGLILSARTVHSKLSRQEIMFNFYKKFGIGQSHDASDASLLNRKIKALYLLLGVANVAVWVWALIGLHTQSALLGTALLAYSFGLRHALDADHIAAIDNVTRKMMQEGKRPVTVGFCFALGHSLVVVVVSLAIALMTKSVTPFLPRIQEYGGLISSTISIIFLLAIGSINVVLLIDIYRNFDRARQGRSTSSTDVLPAQGNFFARLYRPLFGNIHTSWQMIPLGFLFGLGFETATEVAVLSTSAMQASQGASLGMILLFPCLFTVGMLTIDATDGVLMLRVYGWAFIKPLRKLYYNMMLTLTSTLLALIIAAIGIGSLIQENLHMDGFFWAAIHELHESYTGLGYVIISVFVLSWLGSEALYRMKGYDALDAAS